MRAKRVAAGKPGDPKGCVTYTDSFQIETLSARCKTRLRLISVITTEEETSKKILSAMGLPTKAPCLHLCPNHGKSCISAPSITGLSSSNSSFLVKPGPVISTQGERTSRHK